MNPVKSHRELCDLHNQGKDGYGGVAASELLLLNLENQIQHDKRNGCRQLEGCFQPLRGKPNQLAAVDAITAQWYSTMAHGPVYTEATW